MIAGTHSNTSKGGFGISGLPKGKEVSRMEKIKRFLKDEQGATAIEYGLIASLIAVAIVVGATAVGTNLNNAFTKIAAKIVGP